MKYYEIKSFVNEEGFVVDKYLDPDTGELVKYCADIEILTERGPTMGRGEFKDCKSLEEAFQKRASHRAMVMEEIQKIRSEMTAQQNKKIVTPQDFTGGNKLIVP